MEQRAPTLSSNATLRHCRMLAAPKYRLLCQAQTPRRAGRKRRHESPGIEPHLRVLRRAGLCRSKGSRTSACGFKRAPDCLEPVQHWMRQVEDLWRRQLHAFKVFAESPRRTRPSSGMIGDRARSALQSRPAVLHSILHGRRSINVGRGLKFLTPASPSGLLASSRRSAVDCSSHSTVTEHRTCH